MLYCKLKWARLTKSCLKRSCANKIRRKSLHCCDIVSSHQRKEGTRIEFGVIHSVRQQIIIQRQVLVVEGKGIYGTKQAGEFLGHLICQSVLPIPHKYSGYTRVSPWTIRIDKGSTSLRADRTHLHNSVHASVWMAAIVGPQAPPDHSTDKEYQVSTTKMIG